MKKHRKILAIVCLIIALAGCSAPQNVEPQTPTFEDVATALKPEIMSGLETIEAYYQTDKDTIWITMVVPAKKSDIVLALKSYDGADSFKGLKESLLDVCKQVQVKLDEAGYSDKNCAVAVISDDENDLMLIMNDKVIMDISVDDTPSKLSRPQLIRDISESTYGTNHEQSQTEPLTTLGQKNALSKAKAYLNAMPFSYAGLIDQLKYEGYTDSEAKYGADNCGADWNEQAAKKAKAYLDAMAFSRSGLIEQLEYEGFTNAQAMYGVEQNGY